jgi:hypothetical protein
MASGCTTIAGSTPGIIPTVEREQLCPAFGYSHSSTTMKVMKFAEYIPIIGMVVGAIRLAWSIKKWSEGASEAGSHILRALVALTNLGFVLVFKDLMEEIPLAHDREERLRPSREDELNFTHLETFNKVLEKYLTSLDWSEQKGGPYKIPYLQGHVRFAAKEILAIDVPHPDFHEKVLQIKTKARAALQRVDV